MTERTVNPWCEATVAGLVGQFEAVMAGRGGTFAELEAGAMALANEVTRQWLQRQLARMGGRYEQEVLVDGQRYRRHAEGTGEYHTLCGKVEVQRDTYRLVGKHNGPTVVPLELEAGIVDHATPALATSVLHGFAAMPDRDYIAQMAAAHRPVPSRSTLGRISKRLGKKLCAALPVIEPVLRAAEEVPPNARSLQLGLDRTAMRMFEWLPALPPRWLHGRKRRPPAPVTVAFRMPYVATLSFVDEDGDVIRTVRLAATAAEGAVGMMERLGAELRHVLAQRPDLPVVIVQDGAPELWKLVEEWFGNLGVPIAMKLIDRYHVDERLAKVAEIIERDPVARRRLLAQWRDWMASTDRAMKRICDFIEAQLYELPRHGEPEIDDDDPTTWPERKPRIANKLLRTQGDEHLGYFRRYAGKMHYKSARKRGFAIGSGATEGACKSVVGTRCKRSGQRWFELGASVVLQVRTLSLNGRLEGAISRHIHMEQHRVQAN